MGLLSSFFSCLEDRWREGACLGVPDCWEVEGAEEEVRYLEAADVEGSLEKLRERYVKIKQ